MTNCWKSITFLVTVAVVSFCAAETAPARGNRYVVTNDDNAASGNTITVYRAAGTATAPTLKLLTTLVTGGLGDGDGYLAGQQQAFVAHGSDLCLFISDAGSADIAAFNVKTQTLAGNFRGSFNDNFNSPFGISLLPSPNGKLLYAGFRFVNNLATFKIGAGCTLTFVSDVQGFGSQGGEFDGMAAHGDILVVGYADGSIESFNMAHGTPVSNHDKQNSSGFGGGFPAGVQITRDGHFAVFGDATSFSTEVEISDISSGKLTPTVDYGGRNHSNGSLGPGLNSNTAVLSSDEKHIYVSNNFSGQVTVLNFDANTGLVTPGCISSPLRGFGQSFNATGQLAEAGATDAGDVLWVAEDGNGSPSGVGIVALTFSGSGCTAAESDKSPVGDSNSTILKSLTAF
jgi:hypothetical protein